MSLSAVNNTYSRQMVEVFGNFQKSILAPNLQGKFQQ